jgi:branched-chain amino acid transport system substrate-binding protein
MRWFRISSTPVERVRNKLNGGSALRENEMTVPSFRIFAAVTIVALAAGANPAWPADNGPIRVGIDVPLTGFFADSIKPSVQATQLWEKQINAQGGLLGRKVEITTVDNKSNPETGVSVYQNLLQQNYDFIFEDGGSLMVQRESTVAEQHHRLMLAPAGFAQALYKRGYKYLFFTGNSLSEDSTIGLAKLVASLPADKRPSTIAYATLENIAFTAQTRGFQDNTKNLNLKSVLDVTYPANLNDATPIIQNIKQQNAGMVFQTGLSNDTVLFVRAAAQQGLAPPIMAVSYVAAALPNFIDTVKDAADLDVYATGWEPEIKNATNPAFVQSYEDTYHERPTYNGAHAFARWQILEKAVTETKSLGQDVLRDYISSHPFDTVVGPIKYNELGYSTPDDTIVVQFQKGRRVIVWPKDQANGELVLRK